MIACCIPFSQGGVSYFFVRLWVGRYPNGTFWDRQYESLSGYPQPSIHQPAGAERLRVPALAMPQPRRTCSPKPLDLSAGGLDTKDLGVPAGSIWVDG